MPTLIINHTPSSDETPKRYYKYTVAELKEMWDITPLVKTSFENSSNCVIVRNISEDKAVVITALFRREVCEDKLVWYDKLKKRVYLEYGAITPKVLDVHGINQKHKLECIDLIKRALNPIPGKTLEDKWKVGLITDEYNLRNTDEFTDAR